MPPGSEIDILLNMKERGHGGLLRLMHGATPTRRSMWSQIVGKITLADAAAESFLERCMAIAPRGLATPFFDTAIAHSHDLRFRGARPRHSRV
jgi:hypothetical protein